MRKTKTVRNIGRECDLDHLLDASGIEPVSNEMILAKLEEQTSFKTKVVTFFVFFLAISLGQIIGDVISYMLNIK